MKQLALTQGVGSTAVMTAEQRKEFKTTKKEEVEHWKAMNKKEGEFSQKAHKLFKFFRDPTARLQ